MNISGISSSELQRAMNEAIAKTATTETGKTASATVNGNSLTISYVDAAGNTVTMDPIELEEAADGGILADPQAIKDLMGKIEKSFSQKDIQLDKKLVEDFTKCLQNEIDKAQDKGEFSSIHDTYGCIFAIMRLLQQANNTMKKAAQAAREHALQDEINAINNQADAEKYAAWTGLFTAAAVAAVQVVVSGIMKFNELSADVKADKVLADKGVLANEKMMENAKLLEMPDAAKFEMDKCSKGMNVQTLKDIAREVGGFSVSDDGKFGLGEKVGTEVGNARAELEQMIESRNKAVASVQEVDGKFKIAGSDKQFDTKEAALKELGVEKLDKDIDVKKAELVSKIDDKVGDIKQARDNAETELKAAKAELEDAKSKAGLKGKIIGTKEWKELAKLEDKVEGCKTKLDNLNQGLVFADAVRTNVFAMGVKGEPLLSHEQCVGRQEMAKMKYDKSFAEATATPEYRAAMRDSRKWDAINRCNDYLCNMLNSLAQQIPNILRAEAEKLGTARVEGEAEYATANDLVQAIGQSQNKVNEMFKAIIDSWLANMRQAMA